MLRIAKSGVDIGIVIGDVSAQRRFYGELLGLADMGEIPLPNGKLYIYACGSSLLKLYAIPGASGASSPGEFGTRKGLAYITLNVEDIEEVLAALQKGGANILTPLSEFDAGVALPEPVGRVRARYAMIGDPEGNRVELLQRL
ncbi:MAG TPA: VOC family protein [Rhizomicrobium sp.]|nr:VOC family protein [Rhizomicrobium sp.]